MLIHNLLRLVPTVYPFRTFYSFELSTGGITCLPKIMKCVNVMYVSCNRNVHYIFNWHGFSYDIPAQQVKNTFKYVGDSISKLKIQVAN
jgi:hypothetical protein